MTDPLRAELERIIDDHFDPGAMARAQAVDELLQAIEPYVLPVRSVGVFGPAPDTQLPAPAAGDGVGIRVTEPSVSAVDVVTQLHNQSIASRRVR